MLSKEALNTILKVFGKTRPGIEHMSPGPLANTQPTRPMSRYIYIYIYVSTPPIGQDMTQGQFLSEV